MVVRNRKKERLNRERIEALKSVMFYLVSTIAHIALIILLVLQNQSILGDYYEIESVAKTCVAFVQYGMENMTCQQPAIYYEDSCNYTDLQNILQYCNGTIICERWVGEGFEIKENR